MRVENPEGLEVTEYEPTRKEVGTYSAQVYSASVEFGGLTWHRTHIGDNGTDWNGTDWVADLSATSLTVTHYHGARKREGWGHDGTQTFQECATAAIEQAARGAAFALKRYEDATDSVRKDLQRLTEAAEALRGAPRLSIYHITRTDNRRSRYDDFVTAFVIAAETATDARKIAADNALDEGRACWLDPATATLLRVGRAAHRIKSGQVIMREAAWMA